MRLLPIVALIACGKDAPPVPANVGSAPPRAADAAVAAKPEPDLDVPDEAAAHELVDAACPRVVAPYYFRVEKAGKVSYLLGTRHMSIGLGKMPATVRDQLIKAQLVVFETPPDDDNVSEAAPDRSLPDQLGPELWGKYKRLVGDDVADRVENASPAVAMVSMMMLFEDKRTQLDTEIEQLVADAKIKTAGLESSAFQDKLLAGLLDLRMLKASITYTPDRAELRRDAIADIKEYCDGSDDDPTMDKHTRELLHKAGYTDAEIAHIDDVLLYQRNAAWMPKLGDMLGKGGVVVVVGADHLKGPRGVIAQLGKQGFATARVH
jgi:hypothetical protein